MIETVVIKYDGQRHEISGNQLDMAETPTDADVLEAVAAHLEADDLNEFVVEPPHGDAHRETATVLTLRPTATYGLRT